MISTNVVFRIKVVSLVSMMLILVTVGCTSGSKFQKYTETQLRNEIAGDGAPEWVKGQVPVAVGQRFFIGVGGGYNVLDERAAFDEAMEHARAQLANYVGTRVAVESCLADWSKGARFLPIHGGPGAGESADQALRSRSHALAENIVGELYSIEKYWEQWQVDEDPDRLWESPEVASINVPGAVMGAAVGSLNNGDSEGATIALGAVTGAFLTNPNEYQMRRYKCWVLTSVSNETIDMYVGASLASLEREIELLTLEDQLATKEAELLAARKDIGTAQDVLNTHLFELQYLRERVHYGRRFRLTAKDDYLSYRAPFSYIHPEWREAAVFTRTEVETREVIDHVHDDFCAGTDGGCLLDH